MLIHEDPHLNMFWVYGSKIKGETNTETVNVNYLENNITKALINTIETLPNDSCRISFLKDCEILPKEAEDTTIEFEFRLQRKPSKEEVTRFPVSNRLLWGISPTGDAWDMRKIPIEKINFDNRKESIQFILVQIKDELETNDTEKDFAQNEAARLFDEIKAIHNNKGDSIPDGWILVYKKKDSTTEKEPLYCIAIENKWHKLDPYQLVNHWEKSLFIPNGKTRFSKYADIYKTMRHFENKSPIVAHFLEYMSLIGEEPFCGFCIEDFSLLNDLNNQNLVRKKFIRFFDKFMTDFINKNNKEQANGKLLLKYDNKNLRLYIERINSFNLFFDFYKTSGNLQISTEIGVDRSWINCCLLPYLKINKEIVFQLESQYKNCFYARHVRLNNKSKSVYFWIKEFNSLSAYLNELSMDRIAVSQKPKEECIQELVKLGVDSNNERLKDINNWKWKTWHWLEYLRIIEDIDIKDYCGETAIDSLNKTLTEIITRQCEGLVMLDGLLKEAQK